MFSKLPKLRPRHCAVAFFASAFQAFGMYNICLLYTSGKQPGRGELLLPQVRPGGHAPECLPWNVVCHWCGDPLPIPERCV